MTIASPSLLLILLGQQDSISDSNIILFRPIKAIMPLAIMPLITPAKVRTSLNNIIQEFTHIYNLKII